MSITNLTNDEKLIVKRLDTQNSISHYKLLKKKLERLYNIQYNDKNYCDCVYTEYMIQSAIKLINKFEQKLLTLNIA